MNHRFAFAIACCALFTPQAQTTTGAPAAPSLSAIDGFAPMAAVQRHLAGPAGFGAGDFDLLINFRAPPPRSPSAVLSLLRAPHSADSLVPALRRDLKLISEGAPWHWLDVIPSESSSLSQVFAGQGLESDPVARARSGEEHLRRYAAQLSVAEHQYVRREAPGLFRHNADDTLLGPVERERTRLRGEVIVDSVLTLAERLPMAMLADAARDFDFLLHALMQAVRADSGNPRFPTVYALLRALQHEGLPVIYGSPGDDTHHLDALLAPMRRGIVFDPSGNDRYVLSGMAQPGGWLIILDVSGDDVYDAGAPDDSTASAAAFASIQLIADLGGNDVYEGGDFAFGSALMGYARLYDAAGDDRYTGRSASLGFAFHGLGILHDRSGNDVYSSAFLSQGAASTFGLGLLLDESGDDEYISRPEFLDDLRYRDRFLSLSQGFSTGFAPRYGGGIGVLWDRAGDDRYTADIFGQGAGYWFGLGVLMDDDGNDSLKAHQYAQGAGVHFAVGMLLDGGGDDVRVSKGVSQGCGHDGAFGLFVDADGNDHNIAVDMSAGAGSANGLGVMIDAAGDDVHEMTNHAMTLGHGDMRRDRASMGFFLDLGGEDRYPRASEDTTPANDVMGGRAQTAKPHPRSDAVWRVYDGVKRGHGFGKDAPP
jgi:hypothetical protein